VNLNMRHYKPRGGLGDSIIPNNAATNAVLGQPGNAFGDFLTNTFGTTCEAYDPFTWTYCNGSIFMNSGVTSGSGLAVATPVIPALNPDGTAVSTDPASEIIAGTQAAQLAANQTYINTLTGNLTTLPNSPTLPDPSTLWLIVAALGVGVFVLSGNGRK
jgi:hypothetical protein